MYKRTQGKATSRHSKTYYIIVLNIFYVDDRDWIASSDTDVYYLAKVNVVSSNLIARSKFLHHCFNEQAENATYPMD